MDFLKEATESLKRASEQRHKIGSKEASDFLKEIGVAGADGRIVAQFRLTGKGLQGAVKPSQKALVMVKMPRSRKRLVALAHVRHAKKAS